MTARALHMPGAAESAWLPASEVVLRIPLPRGIALYGPVACLSRPRRGPERQT
jgi:hypothetical protein